MDVPMPMAHNCFVYVFSGEVDCSGQKVGAGMLGVLEGGERLVLGAGAEGADVLVCDGMPIREPVARYGPFVMNTKEELVRAFKEYESGALAT